MTHFYSLFVGRRLDYTFKNCKFSGTTNWAGTLIISYAPLTLDTCTFSVENGVRLAQGMTADDVTLINTATGIKIPAK